MGMVVQHNMNAINAYNKLNTNVAGLKKSSEKLASGYRINRAGDDAAGLAISEKMRSQIRGLNQAKRNAQDGINMIQTYEGAAQETHNVLQRMKELADEVANGTYQNEVDRDAAQLEFDQLNDELNQLADTDFNGVVALNGGVMADGTIVNNSDAVAARPTINYTQNGKEAGNIVYSENTNATINNSGAGTIVVNGVRIVLNSGKGSYIEDDGSSYNVTDLTVNGGKLNATVFDDNGDYESGAKIEATEKFKVNQGQTEITINGKSYTLKWETETTYPQADGTELTEDDIQGLLDAWTDAQEKLEDGQVTQGAVDAAKKAYDDAVATKTETYKLKDIVDADGNSLVNDVEDDPATDDIDETVSADEIAQKNGFDGKLTISMGTDGAATITTKATYGVDENGNIFNVNTKTVVGSVKISEGVSTPDAYDHGSRNLTYTSSLVLQSGARSKDAVNFNFAYTTTGIGNLKSDLNISARGLGTDQLTLATQEQANFAIDQIDNAINKVSMVRATFGAIQNRLEHKIDNLTTNSENLQEAESSIRDTDMAQEMMNYTKFNILQQAAQSMLAQANQQPQSVLQLLG